MYCLPLRYEYRYTGAKYWNFYLKTKQIVLPIWLPSQDAPAKFNRTNKIDKDYTICKYCLVKVKYTGNTMNMQSHLQHHHLDLHVDQVATVMLTL